MRFTAVLTVLLTLAALGAGRGEASIVSSERQALRGLARAAATGRVPGDEAAADRAVVRRAAFLARRLPASRGAGVAAVLGDVARLAPLYTAPRARALFGMLRTNGDWFATHAQSPRLHQDIADADGVIYRYFPGHGFQFHPLGNMGALNAAVASGDSERTSRLAHALLARGVRPGKGLYWEYYFRFSGGRPPWTSGMAQAVGAQALARASKLLGDDSMAAEAGAAYRTIPAGLLNWIRFGPWIRLYSFDRSVVLNAQLQTAISVGDYANLTGDPDASWLAGKLRAAAAAGLPSFDTGFWSLYSLSGDPSPLEYHLYVVSLLRKLAASTRDARFASAAARFSAYTRQPPALMLADPSGPAGASVRFWLSKPSRVTVAAAGRFRTLWLGQGWHSLSWSLGGRTGLFPVNIWATDYAGNRAHVQALPLVRVALARARGLSGSEPLSLTGLPSFAVGAGVQGPAEAAAATAAGLQTMRLAVPWAPGAGSPAQADVDRIRAAAAGASRLVVQLAFDSPPADAGARAQLASFGAGLVQQVPAIQDLVVGSAGSSRPAGAYAPALAAVYNAVKAVAPAVRIAGALDGAGSPAATLSALGRSRPPMDELAFHPAPGPAKGKWAIRDYGKLVAALAAAFSGGDRLTILYDGVGAQTRVPPAKSSLYTTEAAAAPGLDERAQALVYRGTLTTAACQPTVAGVLFDRAVDTPDLGGQDGLYYPDGTPKASVAALRPALVAARRGSLAVCPGLAVPAAPSALGLSQQPAFQDRGAPWSVGLGCQRDCLYLVTLERARDGVPLLARRGSLRGAAAPVTVTLPRLKVPAGEYRLAVRLVTQVNPGAIFVGRSAPITAG